MDKYNPDQFEIIGLGIANLGLSIGVQPYKPEHKKYRKEIQKRGAVDGDLYMMNDDEVVVHILGVVQALDVDIGANLVVGFDLDDVLDGTALRRAGAFRNLVHLEPEAAALLREEEHRIVH